MKTVMIPEPLGIRSEVGGRIENEDSRKLEETWTFFRQSGNRGLSVSMWVTNKKTDDLYWKMNPN